MLLLLAAFLQHTHTHMQVPRWYWRWLGCW
jgi:hypothetical protein